MLRPLWTIVTILALIALAGTAPQAAAQTGTGSVPSGNNSCSNPRLAQNATGWSTTSGGTGSRRAVTGHVAAAFAYRVSTYLTRATIALPRQQVTAGQRWTFSYDAQAGRTSGVRVSVDWYNAGGGRISRVDGPVVSVGAAAWTRVSVAATAPTGATRVAVSGSADLARTVQWSSTACDYSLASAAVPPTTTPPSTTTPAPTTVPPTTTTVAPTTTVPATTTLPPTTVPPTTAPPTGPGDGTQAATTLGWGPQADGDEFEGSAVDTAKWGLYNSPGHAGEGLRRPSQISVKGGILTIAGTSNGTTGGMAMEQGRKYGRWEARMQIPKGDFRYHPVLILWPDAEDFPVGGEVDYAETTTAASKIDFFLHYSSQNKTTTASRAVDLTSWHNYAVEWTPTGIRGYIDGVQFFSDLDPTHLPPRSMHQTIQLDWFPSGAAPTTPSSMNVAWVRIYDV